MVAHPRSTAALRRLAVLGSLVLVAACSATPEPASEPVAPSETASVGSTNPEPAHPSVGSPSATPRANPARLPAAHVHAIARDPGSGELLVAAHDGLYVYDGATPKRVGPVIDLMGFTVAGPDHYYASGHPGTATDMPQPVGLIESRDGGRAWAVLSRGGQSDFHALTTSGRTVVGFDEIGRAHV